jgi:hypothetical protein
MCWVTFWAIFFTSSSGHPDLDTQLSARVARWYIFKTKNSNFGTLLKALEWNILVYFMTLWYFKAIWCIYWHFGIFFGHFGTILPFLFNVPRKIWQPCFQPRKVSDRGDVEATRKRLNKFQWKMFLGCENQFFPHAAANFAYIACHATPVLPVIYRCYLLTSITGTGPSKSNKVQRHGGAATNTSTHQGCQIFLYLIYQKGGKYTKLPLGKFPNGHKIYLMALTYSKCP